MTEDQLKTELARTYRCIQGLHHSHTTGEPFAVGYHIMTIAAAKRSVFEGELDGSSYFEGKHVDVLHATMRLPAKEHP